MIKGSGSLKERLGRVAYVISGSENLRLKAFGATIKVDGATWFKGKATCMLLGNVGEALRRRRGVRRRASRTTGFSSSGS